MCCLLIWLFAPILHSELISLQFSTYKRAVPREAFGGATFPSPRTPFLAFLHLVKGYLKNNGQDGI